MHVQGHLGLPAFLLHLGKHLQSAGSGRHPDEMARIRTSSEATAPFANAGALP